MHHISLQETKLYHVTSSTTSKHQRTPLWYTLAISTVLLFSLFLNFYQLGQNGYGNLYYAAAIKSMLINWHNFFFVSFDAGGFVSVDKPPLGFWLEALSAKIFGFSPLSLLLPSALAGVISVALLAHLVRRTFGPTAGLLAGLTLAITPISVVTARNVTIDSLLVLILLLAAWMISLAAETGLQRFLFLCALLVGLGFNIKTLEAYLVVPAFTLLYWFSTPHSWKLRLCYLGLTALLLLAVSLSWSTCVDLIAPAQRPYVGSSSKNSEIHLSLFYNGLDRFIGVTQTNTPAVQAIFNRLPAIAFMSYQIGYPGIGRLISPPLGGQIGLLLPCAFLGLIGVRWDDKPTLRPLNRQQQAITLWGIWFLVSAIFFSSASFFHDYYTTLMAPAICALVGIGVVTTWQGGQRGWRKWLLPGVFLATASIQAYSIFPFTVYAYWLLPPLLSISLLTTGGLLFGNNSRAKRSSVPKVDDLTGTKGEQTPRGGQGKPCPYGLLSENGLSKPSETPFHTVSQPVLHHSRKIMTACGFLILLLTPLIWSLIPVLQNRNGAFPFAGPVPQETSLQLLIDHYNTELTNPDPALIDYLLAHQNNAQYLVATNDSTTAAPIILATGKPVMALGGYNSQDQILTQAQLAQRIHSGSVRFFLLTKPPAQTQLAPELKTYLQNLLAARQIAGYQDTTTLATWITMTCTPISSSAWQTHPSLTNQNDNVLELYDCANTKP